MSQFYRRQTINQSSIIFYLQNEKLTTIVNISTLHMWDVAGLPEEL